MREIEKKILFETIIWDHRITRWNNVSLKRFWTKTDRKELVTPKNIAILTNYRKDLPFHLFAEKSFSYPHKTNHSYSLQMWYAFQTHLPENASFIGQKYIGCCKQWPPFRASANTSPSISWKAFCAHFCSFIRALLVRSYCFFSKSPSSLV